MDELTLQKFSWYLIKLDFASFLGSFENILLIKLFVGQWLSSLPRYPVWISCYYDKKSGKREKVKLAFIVSRRSCMEPQKNEFWDHEIMFIEQYKIRESLKMWTKVLDLDLRAWPRVAGSFLSALHCGDFFFFPKQKKWQIFVRTHQTMQHRSPVGKICLFWRNSTHINTFY